MSPITNRTYRFAILVSVAVFLIVMLITQYLSYQQFLISKEKERDILDKELSYVKDKFRNILYSDMTAANTLVLIYKEYGIIKNFDSIAKKILKNSKYAEVLQLTDKGIITNVYPLKGYESTLGINTLVDSLRNDEAMIALRKGDAFFAGPRTLRQGGIGILAKSPIMVNGKLKGFATVLTKIQTIIKALQLSETENGQFSYILTKFKSNGDSSSFALSKFEPHPNSPFVNSNIPEGNWKLQVAYNENYSVASYPYFLSLLGLLAAILLAFFTYRKALEPFLLKDEIETKTYEVNERVKELTTIYKLNNILHDEDQGRREVFQRIVDMIPSGWQFPEICGAKILLEDRAFISPLYQPSDFKQTASFELMDGKKGSIEIVYIEEKPANFEGPFLKEERDLINSIANTITVYFNKAAQKRALIDSETKFRGAFENSAIGMCIVSLTGRFTSVNKGLSEMIGYKEDELIGLSFQDITHIDDLANDMTYIANALRNEQEHYRTEKRFIHKNGSIVWINVHATIIKDSDGKPSYFVAQIENITDKIESQLKFKNLVEQAPVGVYILKDNKFVYVNPAMVTKSGYSEEELLNLSIDKFVHPEDLEKINKNINIKLIGEVAETHYEIRAYTKKGDTIWIELNAAATVYDGGPAIIGTMVNVTEKKTTLDELTRSEANLRSVFNTAEVSYLLLDRQFKVLSFNPRLVERYEDMSGIIIKKGDSFFDVTGTAEQKEERMKIDLEVLRTGKVLEREMSYWSKKYNQTKHALLTISPVIVNGEVVGVCRTSFDITNRKNLELEREKMVNDLTQRNRDLEQFSYIVSHNIRSPLATLLGLSNMLKYELPKPEEKKVIDGMVEWANKLDNVVKDVNDILNTKKQLMQSKTKIDLNDITRSVMGDIADIIKKTNTTVDFDFSKINSIEAVSPYMHSIFLNLISNSIKYAQKDVTPEIKIWSEQEDGKINIYFKDNGMGIDLKKHGDQLFGLYKKFNFNVEGKGMGLFMVKTQVNALGGTIEVKSELEKGTEFKLSFATEEVAV